jgi:Tol biopolymer transport system component
MPDFRILATRQLTDGAAVDLRPQWNVDARSIVFERLAPNGSELWILRIGPTGLPACEPLGLCNAGARRARGRAAFFAQDDFAFVSDRSGPLAIWRANLANRTVVPLTQPVADESDYGPATAPDAHGRFLFFRTIGGGKPHLFEGRLGRGIQPLTVGAAEADQAWFLPGAREIVFHSRRHGVSAVWRQEAAHAAVATRLGDVDEETNFVTPFPSPDGSHVAFTSAAGGVSQVWVMRVDGSHRQCLTEGPVPACFPAWSPSGKDIVFVRGDPLASQPSGALVRLSLEQTVTADVD